MSSENTDFSQSQDSYSPSDSDTRASAQVLAEDKNSKKPINSNAYATINDNYVGSQNARSCYNVSQDPENFISKFLRTFFDIYVHIIKSF